MIHRQDNTFVITKSGYPYHVTADMPEYAGLLAEYADNPVAFTEEYPPVIPEPTPAELALAEINRLEGSITARNLRSALLGDNVAIAKITATEAQIAELRKQL